MQFRYGDWPGGVYAELQDGRRRIRAQRADACGCDHADDAGERADAHRETVTDGILAWKEALGEHIVDETDRFGGRRVLVIEEPTANESCSDRREVAVGHAEPLTARPGACCCRRT